MVPNILAPLFHHFHLQSSVCKPVNHQSTRGMMFITVHTTEHFACRNCALLWPISACCVVVLPWSVALLGNTFPISCQIIWKCTPYKVCPHHNGNPWTCATSPASNCDLHYWGSKWFWTDQISPTPVYWVANRFHILLPSSAHQHSHGYWNSPAHHNILDHS